MPNHMARAYVMLKCITNPSASICSHYSIKFIPIPFYLADLTLMAYLSIFSPLLAEKIAIFVLLSLFVVFWHILYININKSSNIGYFAGLILVLSHSLYMGFYASIISLAFGLLWLSIWWKVRDKKTLLNQIFLSLGLMIIFGFHLAGFLYIFMIYCLYDLYKMFSYDKDKIKLFAINVIKGFPIFVTFFGLYFFQQLSTQHSIIAKIEHRTLFNKIENFLYPFLNYSRNIDVLLVFSLFLILVLAIDKKSIPKLPRNFWTTVSAVFFFAYIITPVGIHGGYDVDSRFLPLAYLALFLAAGSVAKKNRVYSYAVIAIILVSFLTSLYYKNITNSELVKVYDALLKCKKDKSLVEINSMRRYPTDTRSKVYPFPHFASYYIVNGGKIVGGLFDCKKNKTMQYFCIESQDMSTEDYHINQFYGIKKVGDNNISKMTKMFDYILMLSPEDSDYIYSRLSSTKFSLIYQKDYVYLFEKTSYEND